MMAVSKTGALLAFVLAFSFLDEAFCMRITKRDVTEGEKDGSSELDSTKTGGNSVSDDESELSKGDRIGHEGDDKPKDGDDGIDGNPVKEGENPSDDGEKIPSDGGGEEPSDDGEKRPSDGGGEEPSDDGGKRPSDGGDEEPSDDGEKRPSDGGGEEPADDGEKRPSDDGGDEEPSDNGGEKEPSNDGEKGPTDGGENGPSDEEVSDGGERRRSTDGGDIGKSSEGKGDGSETTPKNEEDYGKNSGLDDIPNNNSSSEDGDLAPSTTNEGASSDTNSSFNPTEWEDKNSTDNAIETVSDSNFPFRGGFRFDSPFFNFEQVEQYFRKLEDAMENIFQQAMLEVGNSTESFKNSTDKVIVVNGQKYNVHTTLIKGGNENRSISIEAISAVPINNTRKRRSLW